MGQASGGLDRGDHGGGVRVDEDGVLEAPCLDHGGQGRDGRGVLRFDRHHVPAAELVQEVLDCRYWQVGVSGGEPSARVQAGDGELCGRQGQCCAGLVGDAVDRGVVHGDEGAVGQEAGVDVEDLAVGPGGPERVPRVFGGFAGAAAVRVVDDCGQVVDGDGRAEPGLHGADCRGRVARCGVRLLRCGGGERRGVPRCGQRRSCIIGCRGRQRGRAGGGLQRLGRHFPAGYVPADEAAAGGVVFVLDLRPLARPLPDAAGGGGPCRVGAELADRCGAVGFVQGGDELAGSGDAHVDRVVGDGVALQVGKDFCGATAVGVEGHVRRAFQSSQ